MMINANYNIGVRGNQGLANNAMNQLKADPAIQEFLPRVVDYLRRYPQHTEAVVKFLTGNLSHLMCNIGNVPTLRPATIHALRVLLPAKPENRNLRNLFNAEPAPNSGQLLAKLETINRGLNPEHSRIQQVTYFNAEHYELSPTLSRQESYIWDNGSSAPAASDSTADAVKRISSNGVTYIGKFSGGEITGKGIMLYANGDKYIGDLVRGKADGCGVLVDNSGQLIYMGNWCYGDYEGLGIGTLPDDESFIGTWQDGFPVNEDSNINHYLGARATRNENSIGPDDVVEFTLPDNGLYTGNLHNGLPHGYGTVTYPDGVCFTGEFSNGIPLGKGIITKNAVDLQYVGEVVNGKQHGFGCYCESNKTRYEGNWENGLPSGVGTFTYADGSSYSGDFVNGKRHGNGMYIYSDGSKYDGEWVDGNQCGFGTFYYSNGDQYQGGWLDNKRHGTGLINYADGSKYYGDWKQDQHSGQGTFSYVDGAQYIGAWQAGKRQGAGTYINPDQTSYSGTWVNDDSPEIATQIANDLISNRLPVTTDSFFANKYKSLMPLATLNEFKQFYQMLLGKQCDLSQTGLAANKGVYSLKIDAIDDAPGNTQVVIIKHGTQHLLILQTDYFLQNMSSNLISRLKAETYSNPYADPYNRHLIDESDVLTAAEAAALNVDKEHYLT